MVQRLQASGIIWGDAKPDNILAGTDQNFWMVDFWGGYTRGWVDGDKAQTFEGDLQALSKIVDFVKGMTTFV